ncbi:MULTISPECIES: hypothetical protein [unclassified Sporosarcina]|uniref:hypothetical protein n=1 Tax=unclassified Sporosarcina TaxID=2647733 RepID=UPI00203CB9FB|nr:MULTISPECIES: hypothetical protein [unclassified Sporosarcina]GKV64095.1 hypothetical protein NCCP2331_02480 [Sporosarcina sp. NCCP-2331]GLB54440.1 hypothetical protein NCCP2378_02250 [Sporosarcina sp. NCCP-2378]
MKFEEISKVLNYDEKEWKVFISNEILGELKNHIKSGSHIAFAYSYMYLITYLYRYAKYFSVAEILNNAKIKEILGYNPKQQTLDYLIKRNGLLDKIGYTKTTKDYPVVWEYSKEEGLEFTMRSELDKEIADMTMPIPKGFFLKEPTLSLDKEVQETLENGEIDEYVIDGTFKDVENTTMIPFEVFMYCMSNEKIGCIGFYLYAFLKRGNDVFAEGYDVSFEELIEETGLSNGTVNKYMAILKSYKMIDFEHKQEYFSLALPREMRKKTRYNVRDFDFFNEKPSKFQKMKKISAEECAMLLQKEREELQKEYAPNKIEIDTNILPF